jgi:hypothetical protein
MSLNHDSERGSVGSSRMESKHCPYALRLSKGESDESCSEGPNPSASPNRKWLCTRLRGGNRQDERERHECSNRLTRPLE